METVVTVINPIDDTEVEVTLTVSSNVFIDPNGAKALNVPAFGSVRSLNVGTTSGIVMAHYRNNF
jgi:hypothetical protein